MRHRRAAKIKMVHRADHAAEGVKDNIQILTSHESSNDYKVSRLSSDSAVRIPFAFIMNKVEEHENCVLASFVPGNCDANNY